MLSDRGFKGNDRRPSSPGPHIEGKGPVPPPRRKLPGCPEPPSTRQCTQPLHDDQWPVRLSGPARRRRPPGVPLSLVCIPNSMPPSRAAGLRGQRSRRPRA